MPESKRYLMLSGGSSVPESKRYVLWGSAGYAKVLAALILLSGGRVVALFDNNPEVDSVLSSVPLHIGMDGFERWINNAQNRHELYGLVAIGGARGRDRVAIQKLFKANGLRVDLLVHPKASVCDTASIGAGTQILSQSLIAADVRIGEGCIINHGASVAHESLLGDGVHIASGATLCGCVTVGDNVMIGANAVVLPRIVIGSDTIVGAGAVVTRDLPIGVIAVGNPARIVKRI